MDDLIDAVVQLTGSLFPSRPTQEFTITTESFSSLKEGVLRDFLRDTVAGDYIGISALFQSQRRLSSVVLATPGRVLQITGLKKGQRKQARLLERLICCDDKLRLFGADLDVIAYGLFTDAGVLLSNGIDLQTLLPSDADRDSLQHYLDVLGTSFGQKEAAIRDVFWNQASTGNPIAKALVRAREYAVSARQPSLQASLQTAHRVSTKGADAATLEIMAKIHRDSARLDAMKPTVQQNDIAKDAVLTKDGGLVITCSRYKTRIRLDGNQRHEIEGINGVTVTARLRKVKGKDTTFAGQGSLPTKLKSVKTIGKDSLTSAEKNREKILLHFLQDRVSVHGNLVFAAIWTRPPTAVPPVESTLPTTVTARLNPSQNLAVRTVLVEPLITDVMVQLILGPPGTGKTSTIAAMVQGLHAARRPVWIVAQSNVAVKNIASKLGDVKFWDFKLLVSHEFHFDWHEHLYEELESSIIRSDEFAQLTPMTVDRLLAGSCVILCTISMLSNPYMRQAGFAKVVPIENLFVDEASQIDIGDYLHVAHAFRDTLRRLVFVGDDKQLAPYGQDDIPGLQSIFELTPHRSRALLFDQCYRLPTPICEFISRHMYEGKLQSVHGTTSRKSCKFVDVHYGTEVSVGRSWTNQLEADTCIALAQRLYKSGKKDFRIITPYDAQRKVLEDKLKATPDVRWEDTVFCVDSFQGNEAEYIIVSLVRTKKPGFITNARRSNVMLTRCKKGMYICAKRAFLQSPAAKDTLVGKMAKEWGSAGWIRTADVVNNRI